MYRINEVAKLAGVSVRTLHHYDSIGLLEPAEVKDNGYRLYSDEDLSKLQHILFFKELDFPLTRIKEIVSDPGFDQKRALHSHKELLLEKLRRLERIIQSVDLTLTSLEGGTTMDNKDKFEPFDMKRIEEHQQKYEQETKEKYGNTDAYKESARRTAGYKEEDWKRIHDRNEELYRQLIAAMPKGPEDEEVQQIVGAMRQHITDNFYECSTEIWRGLGEMYVADPRFTANIDKVQEGLASFLRDAIVIYCDRLEGK
ncbi:MerR family transcriptional regulator [Paenibacillus sp. GCM10023252]|uniref:MerR family transcriptional regulator n=1 Tax=Paenibacillus sp. GCM10023252 TaxID=3252649 RepID=UPI00360C41F1